jgi:hypothetical protein
MSEYYDENEDQPQYADPLRQAFDQDPIAVITAAATLAAENAAKSVGETVYAERNYQMQQAMTDTANAADAAMTERYGSTWENEKAQYADWLGQRPGFISEQELFDPAALTDTLAAGYRAWRGAKVEESDRLQKMEQKEFSDSMIALHRDSSYAAKMASNGYRDVMDDVQGNR